MDVTGFVFQRSYYEALRGLDDETRLVILDAITDYAFTGVVPEGLSPVASMCFTLIKPTLDASISRYAANVENGKRGGRPKKAGKTQVKNPTEKPKKNLNKNGNSNKDNNIASSPLQEKEANNMDF